MAWLQSKSLQGGCMVASANLGVRFAGVLVISALLLRVYLRAPDFWKVPYSSYMRSLLKGY